MQFRHNIIFLLLICASSLHSQNPHPSFRNYTTNDGLPSPEVHPFAEDNDGYLWIATDNGVSKFDGYTFKNYGIKEGLNNTVVLKMQKDTSGRIWLSTLSGNLYYVENDSILAYAHNDVIQKYHKTNMVTDFFIDASSVIYLNITNTGLLELDRNGFRAIHKNENKYISSFLELEHRSFFISPIAKSTPINNKYKYNASNNTFSIKWKDVNEEKDISGFLYPNKNSRSSNLKRFSDGSDITYNGAGIYCIKDKKILWYRLSKHIFDTKAVMEFPDGRIFAGFQNGGGLRRYKNLDAWRDGKFKQYLKGKSISSINTDSKGDYWISTLENGIFHCTDLDQKIYDAIAGLTIDNVTCLAFINKNEIYFGMRSRQVYLLNTLTDYTTQLPKIPNVNPIIYDMKYDTHQNVLWVAAMGNYFYAENKWDQVLYNNIHGEKRVFSSKKLCFSQDKKYLYGAGVSSFSELNLQEKKVVFNSWKEGLQGRTYSIYEDLYGSVWTGRIKGLFLYQNQQLSRPYPFHDAFNTAVIDITEYADSTLIIGTKGKGVLLWKDDFFRKITRDDGLLTNMIENVHVDSLGRIWVGTLQGLNRISFKNGNKQDPIVESFTKWHGLPSNEINQVRSWGDQVWIATTKGLMQWVEPKKNTSTVAPLLTQMSINNKPNQIVDKSLFKYDQNNIDFHFLTINFNQNGNIQYRYRLNDAKWHETNQPHVNFAQLSPNQYVFEVQSKNENGVWSDSKKYAFSIHPPWWATWWFRLLIFLILMGLAYSWYKKRIQQLQIESDFKNQITALEKAALQAQMNPHFIFNCLNSIQNFILQNDKKKAVEYLSRFASLVRHNLDSSVQGEVSLEDEIAMLENYLSLEQERFNHKFKYNISISKDLEDEFVEIPSMLIQPFVENAVIHGMSTKKKNGMINLGFSKNNNHLTIIIKDNGGGFRQSNDSKYTPRHKSVGMKITKKRLELLGKNDEHGLKIIELKNISGEITGTEVELKIQISA